MHRLNNDGCDWKIIYISTPYVSNDGISNQYHDNTFNKNIYFHYMVLNRYSKICPVLLLLCVVQFVYNSNTLQFDDWVYLIAVVGDTNEQEIFFAVESDPTYLVFCFQPVYVLTCFELFCLPFSMFVPYFRSSEISWRKKLHHKVTVPFHIYMPCIYGTFHSYSFRAIVSIYLCYYEKKSSNIWDLRNMIFKGITICTTFIFTL